MNRIYADILLETRRFDEAIEHYHKTVELDPNLPVLHYFLARAYLGKGMRDQAVEEFSTAAELNKTSPEIVRKLKEVYAKNGWRAYIETNLNQMLSRPAQAQLPPFVMAAWYAQLDNKDEALKWLEKGYTERDFRMTLLGVAFEFDNLRSDPRFKDLVRRMGLPE